MDLPGNKRHIYRGMENEDEDYEVVVESRLKAEFDDWPNEAGFEGLTEVRGPVELTVRGSIPEWAVGTLYRTGPGQYTIENTPKGTFHTTHWFDGFGHSHKFNIVANSGSDEAPVKVEYSSRRQSPALVDAIRRDGHMPNISFGQRRDPCIGLFGKIMSVWRGSATHSSPDIDNVCVTVQSNIPGLSSNAQGTTQSGHRGGVKSLWLQTDACIIKEIDQHTLEPIGIATQKKLHPLLKGPLSCAHAQRDPDTGDFFNFNLELGRYATYRIFRTNASSGTTDILATIRQSDVEPAYIHSFFLSPSFVIFCVPSSHLGLKGVKIKWEGNVADAIEPFDKSRLCKWFIIDRRGDRGVVAAFDGPAGFFFHSINSFEERDETTGDTDVFCDVIEYPSVDVIRSFEMDVLLQNNGATKNFWGDEQRTRDSLARLTRYRFRVGDASSLAGGNAAAEKVFEIKAPHAGELPTINPAYATRQYRYVYSLASYGWSSLFDTIVKTDLETRETVFWDNAKGHTPGEAIFVPRPKAHNDGDKDLGEDDGVLLSVVLDGIGKTSYLVCLDAKTMKELGRAECDFAVGIGFHGLHEPLVDVSDLARL
ncbi:carotenoid oxygenase [Xylariaceae sp. FL0662B]|nr:carotenoid oxygenase [Xylariaceae sp. FL0662B]